MRDQAAPSAILRLHLLAFVAFVVLALAFTWPLAPNAATAVSDNPGDSLFNAWTLAWTGSHLLSGLEELFNANIFYPESNTLAYSETQFLNSLLALPVLKASGNPLLAYNFVLLLSFALSGLFAYLLAHRLTGHWAAALLAGVVFGFSPFRFGHLTQVQLLSSQLLPLGLLLLHHYFERPTWWRAIAFVAVALLQGVSFGYNTIFLVGAAMLYLAYAAAVFRRRETYAGLARLAALALPAALLALPLYLPFFRAAQGGFLRPYEDLERFSAELVSYLAAPPRSALYAQLLAPFGKNEGFLFPGFSVILLALLGAAALLLGRSLWAGRRWREGAFYLLLGFLAFLLTLGPSIEATPGQHLMPGPYLLLYKFVPLFKALRSPARFDMLVVLAMAVAAAYGCLWLSVRLARWRRSAALVPLALLAVVLLEFYPGPLPLNPTESGEAVPQVYRWLVQQPAHTVVVELPAPDFANPLWVYGEVRAVYFSTYHWKRLVNGYSGFISSEYRGRMGELRGFPDERAVQALKGLGVDYVVYHTLGMAPQSVGALESTVREEVSLEEVSRFGSDYLFAVLH